MKTSQNRYNLTVTAGTTTIYITTPGESQPKEDIKVGEIIGYRCWNFTWGKLRSITRNYVWKDGEASGDPWKDGKCGVYAFKHWHVALENAEQKASIAFLVPLVVGTVKMWGKIHEHKDGYRAEYAKIESLQLIIGSRRKLRKVIKNYSQICDTSQLVRQSVNVREAIFNWSALLFLLSILFGTGFGLFHFLAFLRSLH